MDVPMFIYAAGCSIAAVIIGAFMFYKKQDEFILQI